jgi:hypothetical protein
LPEQLTHITYISVVNPTRFSNFSNLFYFWDNTLHVLDGLSVHHEEFKTVHTATGICMYSLELLITDGKTVQNMYSVIPKIK